MSMDRKSGPQRLGWLPRAVLTFAVQFKHCLCSCALGLALLLLLRR